ncbi:MAG: sodium:solute symporter family transporter, partial [Planctomycetia bacterium]
LPHWAGVVMVGAVVIAIVSSAGMVSTTYVQFLKGLLLIVFGFVLTVLILNRGFDVPNSHGTAPGRWSTAAELLKEPTNTELPPTDGWTGKPYVRVRGVFEGVEQTTVWRVEKRPAVEGKTPDDRLWRCQTVETKDGVKLVNGKPQGTKEGEHDFTRTGELIALADGSTCTGPLDPVGYLSTLQKATVLLWGSEEVADAGGTVKVYFPKPTAGAEVMQPGNHPAFKGLRSDKFVDKLNFLSLMLALFCGTASLPHILIRYYTVKDQASARKSTIVGIASIGLFYVLTLYMGLGAMTSGALDVTDSNMAAPLLARSFSPMLFAVMSAIAFTTVLGTVSGLIVAASGAVVHDLAASCLRLEMNDYVKVRLAKITAAGVGVVAVVLGILFEKMNVNYLVGWAFSIAASANLPSLVMLLFWKRTTKQGVAAAVFVGMTSSLTWILLSGDTFKEVYRLDPAWAPVPFSQPGIVTIPLGFLTLVAVSLLTRRREIDGA